MRTVLDTLPDESELKAMTAAAQRIYQEKYKADFEARFPGYIVAIDIATEQAFVGRTSWQAGQQGRISCPDSLLYLLRVGAPTMYVRR
jgi:hypothetical protein